MTYPLSFRLKVMRCIDIGEMNVQEAASFFGISRNTISLWRNNPDLYLQHDDVSSDCEAGKESIQVQGTLSSHFGMATK